MNDIWVVLRVRPTKERVLQMIMEKHKITIEVPLKQVWRRKTRYCKVKEYISVPLTPGYVLLKIPRVSTIPWLKLNQSRLVLGVLGEQGFPKALTAKEATRLLARTKAPQLHRRMRSNLEFDKGDTVVVTDGMFEGMELMVLGITERHAIFYPEIFGRKTKTRIPLDDVAKIG